MTAPGTRSRTRSWRSGRPTRTARSRTARAPCVRDGYTFTGFGRSAVGNTGAFTFTTVNPGPTEEGAAPFIAVAVFARGLMNRLFTRVYLPEDEEALAKDPLLSSLDPDRRRTLIARRDPDGGLNWDIRLQGEGETVFLDFSSAEGASK